MKLLKIKITNMPLFLEPLEINFYAQQRVLKDKKEMLTKVFTNSSTGVYNNNVMSIIGINASGKTTTLKAISFVIQLLNSKSINNISCNEILNGLIDNENVCIETFFYENDKIYKLVSFIENMTDKINQDNHFIITGETLYEKSVKSISRKKHLFDFSTIIDERHLGADYLPEDISIMVKFIKEHKSSFSLIDAINWTDINGLRMLGYLPLELVNFLDPNIEYLKTSHHIKSKSVELKLKFKNKEEITLDKLQDLSKFLSSGTIKGINVFLGAMVTLKNGGYFIIDELENHFNIELVSTIIGFFNDNTTNKHGATIIFSTHYTEIIDLLERNDCIFVARNDGGIKLDNLSIILNRNDVKKSECFKSGYLENTAPSYNRYIKLKRKLISDIDAPEVT